MRKFALPTDGTSDAIVEDSFCAFAASGNFLSAVARSANEASDRWPICATPRRYRGGIVSADKPASTAGVSSPGLIPGSTTIHMPPLASAVPRSILTRKVTPRAHTRLWRAGSASSSASLVLFPSESSSPPSESAEGEAPSSAPAVGVLGSQGTPRHKDTIPDSLSVVYSHPGKWFVWKIMHDSIPRGVGYAGTNDCYQSGFRAGRALSLRGSG